MANSRVTPVLFRDVLAQMAFAFVLLVVLLLPYINEPTKAEDEPPPGLIQVSACWPDTVDADVDVWTVAPGDDPVGFKRRDGKVWSLLRDDLGLKVGDSDNCELVVARGVPAGEYLVNFHAYSARNVTFPVPVSFSVMVRTNGYTNTVRKGVVILRGVGDEQTAVRFRMDEGGRVVAGSIGNITTKIEKP
jgi:hypothetical protein